MPKPDPLLFIDTNIFLDFYRATGSQDFKLLDRLKEIRTNLITTLQVEMEFQKNREKLMLESFRKLVVPQRPEIPGLFANSKEVTKLNTAIKQIDKSLGALKKRLSAAMKTPAKHDPVYKAAKSVFSFRSELNLDRTKKERHHIRELAEKRFVLGYPPRKDRDTSMGDAINWEWIVACAKESGRSVIVVSRDGDYGLKFDDTSYINEWLRHEFSERVKNKCHISLTVSLSDALEEINVHVTQAEREAEKKLIETGKQQDSRDWRVPALREAIEAVQRAQNEALRSAAYEPGKNLEEAIQALQRDRNEELRRAAEEPGKAALYSLIQDIQRAQSAAPTDIDENQSSG